MASPLPTILLHRGEFVTCDSKGHRVAKVTGPIHSLQLQCTEIIDKLVPLDPAGRETVWTQMTDMSCPRCGGSYWRSKLLSGEWSVHVEGKGWV